MKGGREGKKGRGGKRMEGGMEMEGPTYKGREVKREGGSARLLRFPPGARIVTGCDAIVRCGFTHITIERQ